MARRLGSRHRTQCNAQLPASRASGDPGRDPDAESPRLAMSFQKASVPHSVPHPSWWGRPSQAGRGKSLKAKGGIGEWLGDLDSNQD